MTSQQKWRPAPALAKEVSDMLQFFANQFPRAHVFHAWTHSPEQRNDLISTWARELTSVTLAAIGDAAQRWMADASHSESNSRTKIPTAASFAKYAKQVDRQFFRMAAPAGPQSTKKHGRAHDMLKRAYAVLQSWPASYLVVEELRKLAPDAAADWRVVNAHYGTLPTDPWPRVEHFDQAVEIVRAKLERRAARDAAAQLKVG